ncbi:MULTISPECIES: hypothetical protein [Thioclava]|uniref:Uncharacterized protein n=1 Tax=Thioclava litoralis TaxID=3076557 RepID=A0ABZ1E3E3_9RHOB|nr:hypothetical protein RPE78_06170 [Thioclava sp. FTW29]
MSLSTRVIAATTALALSLAAVSPAAAMDSDQKKALGVLIGIGAAAVLIDNMNDKSSKRDSQPRPPAYSWDDRGDSRWNEGRHDRRYDRAPSYAQSCAMKVRTNRGLAEVVDRRCAERTADRRLPQSCLIDIHRGGRTQTVYGQNCLADRGVRMRRH